MIETDPKERHYECCRRAMEILVDWENEGITAADALTILPILYAAIMGGELSRDGLPERCEAIGETWTWMRQKVSELLGERQEPDSPPLMSSGVP